MSLKENETVFQEFEWTWTANDGDANILNTNVKLVSPYFVLNTPEEHGNTLQFAIRVIHNPDVLRGITRNIFYCSIYNDKKFGVSVNAVECTCIGEITTTTAQLHLKVEGTFMKVYVSEGISTYDRFFEKGLCLKYRLYFANICDQPLGYLGYELSDTCFGEEMWSAAQKGVMTDCEFIVQSQTFLAHRAVVASRSPVLAERINSSETKNRIEVDDVTNPVVFKALLYFLYTGLLLPLDSSHQREFVDLAKNYQVEMAEQIHKVFEHSAISAHLIPRQSQEFSKFIVEVQALVQKPDCTEKLRESYGSISIVGRGICLQYDYKRSFNIEDSIIAPETFQFTQGGFLGVTASRIDGTCNRKTMCEFTCSVHLLSGFKLETIEYSENISTTRAKTISNILGDIKVGIKLFRETFLLKQPSNGQYNINIHFIVHLLETNERWGYRLHDPSLPLQLWSASREKIFTDVELRVGNRTFFAHRAILSARSPVFCAMFGSDMNESRTGVVEIKDIDDGVFEEFLQFLYTGRLMNTKNLEELWTAANKYNVITLEHISEPYRVKYNFKDFSGKVLSIL